MHQTKLLCLATILAASSSACLAQSSSRNLSSFAPQAIASPQTVTETQQQSTWKPLWQTVKRERRTTVLKPVQKTYDKVEKFSVMKPVTETKYRERTIEETTYEDVTEMREERRVVQKPVVETEMREQAVPVRTKITETEMRTENVTVLKPTSVTQTQLNPGPTISVPTGATRFRPQLQFLRRGEYTDPATGLSTFRRAGLHWVQPPAAVAVPTVVPSTVQTTALIPEVVQRSEPVEVTRYVDKVELRKVPVQVTKMVDQVEVRKVPVTVRRPKITKRTERIPYQETTYKEQIVTRTTPVTETTYEPVEQIEPYEEQTCRWVQQTDEVKVSKPVQKQIDETMTRETTPMESNSKPSSSDAPSVLDYGSDMQGTSATATPSYDFKPTPVTARLVETSQRQRKAVPNVHGAGLNHQRIDYSNSPIVRPTKTMYRPDDRSTIDFPETRPDVNNPRTKLKQIERPEWLDQANGTELGTKKAATETSQSVDLSAPPAKKPAANKGYFMIQGDSDK